MRGMPGRCGRGLGSPAVRWMGRRLSRPRESPDRGRVPAETPPNRAGWFVACLFFLSQTSRPLSTGSEEVHSLKSPASGRFINNAPRLVPFPTPLHLALLIAIRLV